MWNTVFPYILSGISVGGQYALIAIGYTMVYGILRLINFAHGDVFMIRVLPMVVSRKNFISAGIETRSFPSLPMPQFSQTLTIRSIDAPQTATGMASVKGWN